MSWLTDQEVQKLILSTLNGADGPVSEEELGAIIEWAEETVVNHSILQLALEGMVHLRVRDGEIAVTVSEMGVEKAVELLEGTRDGEAGGEGCCA